MRENTDLRRQVDVTTVKDPTLRAGQRRYFVQPVAGRGRRAFTAAGAARKAQQAQHDHLRTRLADRWYDARERETQRRGRVGAWV